MQNLKLRRRHPARTQLLIQSRTEAHQYPFHQMLGLPPVFIQTS
jgi:hypothetical protein